MQKSCCMAAFAAALVFTGTIAPLAVAQTATVDLDLTSTDRNISATTQQAFTLPVTITEGGTAKSILPTDHLTPAESVAVFQALNGGQQIVLGVNGAATGGTFVVTPLAPTTASLVIPQGVTGVHDASVVQSINLSGNLVNSGSLYALTQNPAVTSATFSAANITNQQTGLISTVLPTGGLPGFTAANSQLNLILNAVQNVVNNGIISSAGSLSVTAGNTITNGATTAATTAVMQAVNNVNLTALSGNIINHGTIASLASNINLSAATAALVVNNVGGTISALNGNINVRDSLFTGTAATRLWGGDYLSQALDINGGSGSVDIDANNINGILNIKGDCAHVTASSLRLGNIDLTGDPTFYAVASFIELNNNLSFPGQHLALIASTDVRVKDGTTISIDTSSSSAAGGQINVFAGAAFTGFPVTEPTNVPPSPGTTASITVFDGNRLPGGQIDFRGLSSINSSGATDGGSVNLLAWAPPSNQQSAPDAGRIRVNGTITATGGTGNNGRVTAIGGAVSGTAVSLSDINNNGNQNGTGGVFIRGDNPTFSGCTICGTTPQGTNGILISPSGNISSGRINISENYFPTSPAGATVGAITSASNIAVGIGGNFKAGAITSMGANSFGSSANTLNGGKVVIAANRVVNDGTVFHVGSPTTNGLDSITVGSGTSSTGTTKQGDITVISRAGVTVDSWSALSYTGIGKQGGNLSFHNDNSGGSFNTTDITLPGGSLDLSATSGNAAGGNISFRAHHVITQGPLTLKANGSGTGGGGTVQITTNTQDQGGIEPGGSLTIEAKSTSGLAGVVRLNSWEPVDYSAGLDVNASSGGPGGGGQIEVDSVESLATANFDVSSTTGSGGTIYVQGHPRTYSTLSNFTPTLARNWSTGASQVNLNATGFSGGHIGFGGANLTTGTGLINLDAHGTGATGTSRQIDIWGNSFTMGSGGLVANANHGGTVGLNSSIDIATINNQANGPFTLSTTASDASGWGANVNVWVNNYSSNGTALTIDTRGLNGAFAGDVTIRNATSGINNVSATPDISIAHLNVQASNTAPAAPKNGSVANTWQDASKITIAASGNVSLPDLTLEVASNGGSLGSVLPVSGAIEISAGQTLALNTSLLSADGAGSAGSGGSVTMSATSITNSSPSLTLSANGVGAGNGGAISLSLTGNTSDLLIASSVSGYILTATGGTAGAFASLQGNGGSIAATAGRNITVDSGGIFLSALGTNGNGGSLSLTAGTGGTGTISLNTDLDCSGTGSGAGGFVYLSFSSSTFDVANQIRADAVTGTPGTVVLANTSGLALIATIDGLISSTNSSGALGELKFESMPLPGTNPNPSYDMSIIGSGEAIGKFVREAEDGTIVVDLPNSLAGVSVEKLTSLKAIQITAKKIVLPNPTSALRSSSTLTLNTDDLQNKGSIFSTMNLQLRFATNPTGIKVKNDGTISAQVGSFDCTSTGIEWGGTGTLNALSTVTTQPTSNMIHATVFGITFRDAPTIITNGIQIRTDLSGVTIDGNVTVQSSTAATYPLLFLHADTLSINSGKQLKASSIRMEIDPQCTNDGTIEGTNGIAIKGFREPDLLAPPQALIITTTGAGMWKADVMSIGLKGTPSMAFLGGRRLTSLIIDGQHSFQANSVLIEADTLETTTANISYSGNLLVDTHTWTNNAVIASSGTAGALQIRNTALPIPSEPGFSDVNVTGSGSFSFTSIDVSTVQGTQSRILLDQQQLSGRISLTSINRITLASATGNLELGQVNTMGAISVSTSGTGTINVRDKLTTATGNVSISAPSGSIAFSSIEGETTGEIRSTSGDISLSGNTIEIGANSSGVTAPFGTLDLGSNGSLTIEAPITSGGSATFHTGSTGNIRVTDNVSASSATFQAGTSFEQPSGTITAAAIAITAGSNITISGAQATSGSLSIVSTNGGITVSAPTGSNQYSLSASEGNLILRAASLSSGTIDLGFGSVLFAQSTSDASLGNVQIVVGSIPSSPIAGSPPSNVTVNEQAGGHVFFGANGISASAPTNQLNAVGRQIIFDTGTRPSSAISLHGNVQITADPPLAPSSNPTLNSSLNEPSLHEKPEKMEPLSANRRPQLSGALSINRKHFSSVPNQPLSPAPQTIEFSRQAPSENGVSSHSRLFVSRRTERFAFGNLQVIAEKGAILLLEKTGEFVRVVDLHDNRRGSVVIENESLKFVLHPGSELVFGPEPISVDFAGSVRRCEHFRTPNGVATFADVSLLSLLNKQPLLRRLNGASESENVRLRKCILKTVACLMVCSASKGAYHE